MKITIRLAALLLAATVLPVLAQDADSKGAISYLNLAREILTKNGYLSQDQPVSAN